MPMENKNRDEDKTRTETEKEEAKPLFKKKKSKHDRKPFLEKLNESSKNISVEPILFIHLISKSIFRFGIWNLNLEKICRNNLNLSYEICNSLIQKKGNFSDYEADVQTIISTNEAWKNFIETLISTIFVIFMGAWSDRTGNRKVCVLLPVFGVLMVSFNYMLSTYFFDEISVEVTMFLDGFFRAITGSRGLIILGACSYVSDISSKETRTYRIGLVQLSATGGLLVGTALSGIALEGVGYYGVFAISGIICIITLIYGCLHLEKTLNATEDKHDKAKSTIFKDVHNLLKETAAVAVKKRESNIRKKIIVTLLIVAINYGPDHGEQNVTYMYVRYRLQWDAVKYSVYSTYNRIIQTLGILLSISLFSKKWGYHDSLLSIMSVMSKMIGSIYLVFVYTNIQMYMVPVVEIFISTTDISLNAMVSKLVPSDETGKINSLFILVQTLAALAFDPTYMLVYSSTLKLFSGSIYIFSALLTLPPMSMLLWFFITHRQELKKKAIENKEIDQDIQMS